MGINKTMENVIIQRKLNKVSKFLFWSVLLTLATAELFWLLVLAS